MLNNKILVSAEETMFQAVYEGIVQNNWNQVKLNLENKKDYKIE